MAKKKNINTQVANNGLIDALGLPVSPTGQVNATIDASSFYSNITQVLLTLQPWVLSYAYKTYGIIQTVIDQPIDDAFRGGVELESKILNESDLEKLKQVMEDNDDWEEIKYTLKWARLFGGGILIANTNQLPNKPMNEKLLKDKPLEFLSSDRWQCIATNPDAGAKDTNFLLDGVNLDKTRCFVVTGKRAPYYIQLRLQGWSLSILEQLLPPLVQFFKAQGVMLELLDEKKIDVLKIFDLANTLASANGTQIIKKRVDTAAANKNYRSMLTMDSKDDYQQKELTMSGMAEMSKEVRIMMASAVKFPVSKIWGTGSSGFSSGEDDLENYNSVVEGEIRESEAKKLIKWVVDMRCLQLFGFTIPDLTLRWKPLRILSAEQEQLIENQVIDNSIKLLNNNLFTHQEAMEYLNKKDIINIQTEASKGNADEFDKAEPKSAKDLV